MRTSTFHLEGDKSLLCLGQGGDSREVNINVGNRAFGNRALALDSGYLAAEAAEVLCREEGEEHRHL